MLQIILVYFKWHWIVELEYDGFAFMMWERYF